jgi:Protein of unknown function (DUF3047)
LSFFLIPLLLVAATVPAAHAEALVPLTESVGVPSAPWHVVGLPRQSKPFTQFSVVELDGRRALRVEADESYGNLVHPLRSNESALKLAWQWRVDKLIETADLRTTTGDDVPLKVCVMFDLPAENVPFMERQLLRIARGQASEPVPAATVCYVWDAQLPPGTALDNAFTRRLRYLVLRSGPAQLRQWVGERRDVTADFFKLFGAEASVLPPIIGVAVGADADNTHSRSLGYVADLVLQP